MSSKTSAARTPPEFLVDRNLGKSVRRLEELLGWRVHLVSEEFPDDAQDVGDAEWIRHGSERGWALITKDRKIRYRENEISALAPDAFLFCLTKGDLLIDEQIASLMAGASRVERILSQRAQPGFWNIYSGGRLQHMWPRPTTS